MLKLGKTVVTNSINEEMGDNIDFTNEVFNAFERYQDLDWGDICDDDKEANDVAQDNGDRIVAKYWTTKGDIYIITEADKSATTILFADEY